MRFNKLKHISNGINPSVSIARYIEELKKEEDFKNITPQQTQELIAYFINTHDEKGAEFRIVPAQQDFNSESVWVLESLNGALLPPGALLYVSSKNHHNNNNSEDTDKAKPHQEHLQKINERQALNYCLSMLIQKGEVTALEVCEYFKKETTPDLKNWFLTFAHTIQKKIEQSNIFALILHQSHDNPAVSLAPKTETQERILLNENQIDIIKGLIEQRVTKLLAIAATLKNPSATLKLNLTNSFTNPKSTGSDGVTTQRQEMFWLLAQACYFEQLMGDKILEQIGLNAQYSDAIRALYFLVKSTNPEPHQLEKTFHNVPSGISFSELQLILCMSPESFRDYLRLITSQQMKQ